MHKVHKVALKKKLNAFQTMVHEKHHAEKKTEDFQTLDTVFHGSRIMLEGDPSVCFQPIKVIERTRWMAEAH